MMQARRVLRWARLLAATIDDFIFPQHCLLTGEPILKQSPLPLVSQAGLDARDPAPLPLELMITAQRHHASDDLWLSSLRAVFAVGTEHDISPILHAIKYSGHRRLAVACGTIMADLIDDLPRAPTMIIPVPVHPARRRERGYNQAEDLAAGMSTITGLPMVCILQRTVHTKSQTQLNDADRQRNVRNVFALDRGIPHTHLQGARCVIVDDVCTTGATLNACAEILIAGGAQRVDAITLGATV